MFFQHAGQGSNLSFPVLETSAAPLRLPACVIGMRREGLEPPRAQKDHQLYRLMQSPLCHLRIVRGKPRS